VTIDVRIKVEDNLTGLHLKQTGDIRDGGSLDEQFQRLKQRLQAVFGKHNVRKSGAILTP